MKAKDPGAAANVRDVRSGVVGPAPEVGGGT